MYLCMNMYLSVILKIEQDKHIFCFLSNDFKVSSIIFFRYQVLPELIFVYGIMKNFHIFLHRKSFVSKPHNRSFHQHCLLLICVAKYLHEY